MRIVRPSNIACECHVVSKMNRRSPHLSSRDLAGAELSSCQSLKERNPAIGSDSLVDNEQSSDLELNKLAKFSAMTPSRRRHDCL